MAALQVINTGSQNVAIGYRAGYNYANNSTAITAVGYDALFSNTTGALNTAVGYSAGRNLTTGYYNTALGYSALFTSSDRDWETKHNNQLLL